MSVVYVFAASKMEGQPVAKMAGAGKPDAWLTVSSGFHAGGNEVVLIIGGMGPTRAGAKARAALGLAASPGTLVAAAGRIPDAVLVIGLCGGLSASLHEGRVVAYTNCLSTEAIKPPLRCSSGITYAAVGVLVSSGVLWDRVVGITSPRIAVKKNDKLALANSGASVVDMESYEILAVAAQAGVPAAVLRVVSDSLETKMPDFNRALNQDGALDGRKALKVVIGSPFLTARLLAANKRAMQHLAKALEFLLPADCFPRANFQT
jgi:nucleoside phosphorylase